MILHGLWTSSHLDDHGHDIPADVPVDELELKADIDHTIETLRDLFNKPGTDCSCPFTVIVSDDWPDTYIEIAKAELQRAFVKRFCPYIVVRRVSDRPIQPAGSIRYFHREHR